MRNASVSAKKRMGKAASRGTQLFFAVWGIVALVVTPGALATDLTPDNIFTNEDGTTISQGDLTGLAPGSVTWNDTTTGVKGGAAVTINGTINNVTLDSITITGIDEEYTHTNAADGNIWGPLYVRGDQAVGTSNATLTANSLNLNANNTIMKIVQDGGTSSGFGGAGRLVNLKVLTLNGGSITGNKLGVEITAAGQGASAHANGGGLAIESEWSSVATLDGISFTNNTVTVSNSGAGNAGAGTSARGGALYLASTNDEDDGDTNSREGMKVFITSQSTVFSGNSAINSTGGLAGGGAIDAEFAVNLSVDGASFTGNSATTSGVGSIAQGGAVRLNLSGYYTGGSEIGVLKEIGTETLSFASTDFKYYSIFANAKFGTTVLTDGNTASGQTAEGGAIWTNKGLYVNGTNFYGNTASGGNMARGGAIHSTDAVDGVLVSGGIFNTNTADGAVSGNAYGGAIWAAGNVYAIGSAEFSDNSATGHFVARGGAIYSEGDVYSSAIFERNFVTAENAANRGGAIYADGKVVDSASEFTGNYAVDTGTIGGNVRGGAIYAGGGVELTASKFTTNSVRAIDLSQGGAVYATGAAGTIANATFSGNYADSDNLAHGGAIWTDQNLTIDGASFTGNHATSAAAGSAQGGAIYFNGTTLALSGVTFRGNYTNDGTGDEKNAIHLASGGVTFTDAGSSASYDYDGIAGTGNVTMAGTGSLYLYGNYENLTGNFALNDGTTYFNGESAINGNVNVASDATLNLENLSAGKSFTVVNLTMAADSTLVLKVDNGNIAGTGDAVIKATGTADIGTTDIRIGGEIKAGNEYLVVDAGSYTDSAGLHNAEVSNLMMTYKYKVDSDNLTITVESSTDLNTVAKTKNQANFGKYLQNNPNNDLYEYIYNDAGSYEDILRAMDTSSGDIHASAGTSIVQHERRGSMQLINRMSSVFMASDANANSTRSGMCFGSLNFCNTETSGIWAEIEGYRYRSDYVAESGQGKTKGYGLSIGADKMVDDWIYGFAFRYGDSRLDVTDRAARVDIDSYSLGLYAGRRSDTIHFTGAFTGGYHKLDSRRTAILGGNRSTYTADYSSKTLNATVETGMTLGDSSSYTVQPFASAMWNGYWNNSFSERGGNPGLRLKSKDGDDDWVSTMVGVRLAAAVGGIATVDANAAWRHTYGDLEPSNSMRFANSPGGGRYTVIGTPLDRNEGIFGAGLSARLGDTAQLRASYDYIMGAGKSNSHEGRLSIAIGF